jgi:hypothetical protein
MTPCRGSAVDKYLVVSPREVPNSRTESI